MSPMIGEAGAIASGVAGRPIVFSCDRSFGGVVPDPSRRDHLAGLMLATLTASMGPPARAAETGWRRLPAEPYGHKQDDIVFVDPANGWYGNGSGKLYRTTDGGERWTKVWDRPGTFIRSLGFLDTRRGFLGNVGVNYYPNVSDPTPLYRTLDGGTTWSPVTAPGLEKVAGICAIDILPVRRVFQGETRQAHVVHAAGRVGGPTAVMRSEDGGDSWRVLDLSKVAGMILDVKFHTPRLGFVAASGVDPDGNGEALILRTTDAGETWEPVYRSGRAQENVWKMSWPSARVGYGTVQSYDDRPDNLSRVFVKTTDGGRTWREQPLRKGPKLQEFGVGFVDEARGWIGCNDTGYETRDGGASWAPAPLGRAVNKIRVVRAAGVTRVFAIGVDVSRLDLPSM
jgi:photosystem II stability/assembly factor-like uncharacterized protein